MYAKHCILQLYAKNANMSIQSYFTDFTVPCIVLTPFHTDDEASWLRNTELHPRWAAPSDLRHLGLKRYPL